MIDLTKLTPGLVIRFEKMVVARDGVDHTTTIAHCQTEEDAEFFVIARNAQDVEDRRGCYAVPIRRESQTFWFVLDRRGRDMPLEYIVQSPTRGEFLCSREALVEADKWMTEQERASRLRL